MKRQDDFGPFQRWTLLKFMCTDAGDGGRETWLAGKDTAASDDCLHMVILVLFGG